MLGSRKLTHIDVDEADQCSGLHFVIFYHSHKCVDLVPKKGKIILSLHSRMPIGEYLWSPSLHVNSNFSIDAYEIVRRVGENEIKVLKQIGFVVFEKHKDTDEVGQRNYIPL